MRICITLLAVSLSLSFVRVAESRPPPASPVRPTQAESIAIGVEGAGIGGTYLRCAADLATALNGSDLRIVPIVGQGSLQNLDDLINLRGVDVAIAQADALASVQRNHILPPGAERSIQYVAKLYDEEIHVIAGSEVHTLSDLKGRTINADLPKSGSAMTARLLFTTLGIPVSFTDDPQDVAIERLKRGEIAAVVRVGGKPVGLFTTLPSDAGLHLLTVPQDDERLLQTYAPGSFTPADYPNLVPTGQSVDTLAVGSVLAVYAWPTGSARHHSVARFVTQLFAHFDRLQQPPAHPKWKEVNLAATVPGWTRFPVATEEVARVVDSTAQQEFSRFLAAGSATDSLTAQHRAALLDQFVRWRRGSRP